MSAGAAIAFHIPPPLLAVALAFWGWQTKNGYAAAGLAIAIALPVLTRLRLDLSLRDKHRIADLTMVLYVAVAASLIATDGLRAGVHASLIWLPGVALPLLLAQTMCVEGRIPLTALFRYLRMQKARGEKVSDPQIDLSGAYLALVLIASGMANQPGYGYFAAVTLIVAAALMRIRPSRVGLAPWLLCLLIAVAAGYGGHVGLYTLQTLIEDWIIDWQLSAPLLDPYRSSTRIGELGRLKSDDAIVLRIYAPSDGVDKPGLLHRASYNHYAGTTWLARKGNLEALRARGDGTLFLLGETAAPEDSRQLKLSQRVLGGRTLLALPLRAIAVNDLLASRVLSNPYGAVQAEMEVPWTFYTALYSPRSAQAPAAAATLEGYAIADDEDLIVPDKERPALEAFAQQLGLAGLAPAEAALRVQSYLAGFEYTTVRNNPFLDLVPGGQTPLAEFLTTSQRGHCEYFATAATLLLRTAGIPARYATGYAVGDWSAWEGAWIVRERHAHAWTRTFIDGQWRDLDTTPAAWFAAEESLAPFGQRIADFLRWAGFRWSTRDGSETRILAWSVVGLAALILVWKLMTEGGLVRLAERARGTIATRVGGDSEFFALEAALARGVPRGPSEALLDWLPRAMAGLDHAVSAQLEETARLHYRYRFDPQGLDAGARSLLTTRCGKLMPLLSIATAARRS